MGLLKLRKNKKFGYTSRYYKNDGDGSPFEIKQKFDKFRKTTGGNSGLKSKFSNAYDDLREPQSKYSKKIILITIAILILIFLFIIDFDLSIFSLEK